jgi:SAM-dependent methyltransferase
MPPAVNSVGATSTLSSAMTQRHSLIRKIQRRYCELGFNGTIRYSAMRALDTIQERAFDHIHHVDTAGVSLPTIACGQGYKGSPPHLVREALHRIGVCHRDYTFLDLGSGKGRTLLIAAEFPFRRIIGLEADPAMSEIARSNFARYRGSRRCNSLTSVCMDVREFDLPPDPLVIYLFNPFTERVIRQVMENVASSLKQHPRPLFLVYLRPLFGHVIEQSRVLKQLSYRTSPLITNHSYAIYGNIANLNSVSRSDRLWQKSKSTAY